MDPVENMIIIGSGPAGWAAGIYAGRANLNPLLFEGEITPENQVAGKLPMGLLSMTTEVENYPGFPSGDLRTYLETALDEPRTMFLAPNDGKMISGPELVELMRKQAENFGTQIEPFDITAVNFRIHPFELTASSGQKYYARTVVIATGASANYLNLESETRFRNNGVSACAVCDGALPRFRNRPIAVVGGGDSAAEEAIFLTKFASKVFIIHRRDQLRASKIMAARVGNHPKIEMIWNSVPVEILGNQTAGVTGIALKNILTNQQTTLDVSGVFMAIGHTPNTKFLGGQLELTEKGFIKKTVPFRTNTSISGVFAAGDVADDYYKQAITAAGTGCMAALDAERWLVSQGF